MLFAPLKSIFNRFSNILSNFNLGSVVVQAPVLAIIGFTLLTVEGVCAAWLPTVATPFPLAWETAVSATLVTSPRVWLPIEVVYFGSANFTYQEPYFPSLVILLFLGSDKFGQLAVWGVGDKQRHMVASTTEPITLL